jgi:uncharacterized protein YndB with AHSA1/START domain
MAEFIFTEKMQAYRDKIFNCITDPQLVPKVFNDVESFEKIGEGDVANGTKFKETCKTAAGTETFELEVSSWKPPKLVAFIINDDGLFTNLQWVLVEEGPDIKVDFKVQVYGSGLKALTAAFKAGAVKKKYAGRVTELKKYLDSLEG